MARVLLIRADGNAQIGLGHVMRCSAVADELLRVGITSTFLSRALPDWVRGQLDATGHGVRHLDLPETASEAEDAQATADLAREISSPRVLLDHYELGQIWTQTLRQHGVRQLAAFDDLAEQARDVDLLVDPSPGRAAEDYRDLVPAAATVLTGPTYAALRPEFALARDAAPEAPRNGGPCRVMISMGGVDPTGATLLCLDALDGRADVTLTVVLGSAAPMLPQIRDRIARMQTPTRLLLDRRDMSALIGDSDLVIGAGGTSALERCALGCASATAIIANNQVHNATALQKAGATVIIPELTAEAIAVTVAPFLTDPPPRAALGAKAQALCDGLGAPRIAAAIAALGSGIALRPALPEDMARIHALQSEPGARRYARTPDVPPLDSHQRWFTTRLARSGAEPFHIVTLNDMPCGFVRLDQQSDGASFEVSILISQSVQGRGIGHMALALLRLAHPLPQIIAEVHKDNAASQRLFASAGYQRLAEDRFASPGWAEIEQRQRHAD